MHDIVIVGAGPAGLTAAIYGRRAGKSVLLIEKETFGGQITHSPKVENYPGFRMLSGMELADKLVEQVMDLGAEIEMDTVTDVRADGAAFTVVGEMGEYPARAVIVAADAVSIPKGRTDTTIKTARTKDNHAILFVFFIRNLLSGKYPLDIPLYCSTWKIRSKRFHVSYKCLIILP